MARDAIGHQGGRRATSTHKERGGENHSRTARRPHRPHIRRFSVHPESWRAYLAQYLTEDDQGIKFDGLMVGSSDVRALYRWRVEKATPELDKADAFLCRHDLNFTFFEQWCEQEGRPVWKHGPPPGFES